MEKRVPRVFGNGARKTSGPKRDEVTGEWRILQNEKLYALYSSPNIIRVIKSRTLRLSKNVAHMWADERCIQGWF
jgi:hypothetical protein